MTINIAAVNKPRGRERILQAARRLMLQQGFTQTTIDEVCEKAHITKGSLFYHFKDKEALGVATVEYHLQLGQRMLTDAPFLKLDDPLQRFLGYIDFIVASTTSPIKEGCLLGVFSLELGSNQHSIVNAEQDGSTIRFEHQGLNPPLGCYTICTQGWDYFFGQSLPQYLESGEGTPGHIEK